MLFRSTILDWSDPTGIQAETIYTNSLYDDHNHNGRFLYYDYNQNNLNLGVPGSGVINFYVNGVDGGVKAPLYNAVPFNTLKSAI